MLPPLLSWSWVREFTSARRTGEVRRHGEAAVLQLLFKEEIIEDRAGTVTEPTDPAGAVMALALSAVAVLLAVVAAVLGSRVALWWRWRRRGRRALAVAVVDQ